MSLSSTHAVPSCCFWSGGRRAVLSRRRGCPSVLIDSPDQRHPQRHPHRNCLVKRYGGTRQEGPSSRQFAGRNKLVQVCGRFLYRSGGADLVSDPGAHSGLDARLGASLVPRHRCHRSERSSPRLGRELEPRNGVLRLDSGPVVARLDAGERLMGLALSEVPALGPCWLPVGYRTTSTAMVALNVAPDATPRRGSQGVSAARARSGGRMVRRGTSRPGGSPNVPAPRSADLDGQVGCGIRNVP